MEIKLYFVQVLISWQWHYFEYGKQHKDILKVNVVYLTKLVIFAFEESWRRSHVDPR